MPPLTVLNREILDCRRCPRLVRHCRAVAQTRRAAYRDQTYHGGPVPNFGEFSERTTLLLVGLAPGAHGANRTGRMFTGDRSGDFLFHALHQAGIASQPTSTHADDGLRLRRTLITAAAHCAPPGNRPTPVELRRCAPFLSRTLASLPRLRAAVCLGRLAFDALTRQLAADGYTPHPSHPPHRPAFAHGTEIPFTRDPARPPAELVVLCSYHPSQQNTFTGRLTMPMLTAVLRRAATLAKG